jgi:hypothetical protein
MIRGGEDGLGLAGNLSGRAACQYSALADMEQEPGRRGRLRRRGVGAVVVEAKLGKVGEETDQVFSAGEGKGPP